MQRNLHFGSKMIYSQVKICQKTKLFAQFGIALFSAGRMLKKSKKTNVFFIGAGRLR